MTAVAFGQRRFFYVAALARRPGNKRRGRGGAACTWVWRKQLRPAAARPVAVHRLAAAHGCRGSLGLGLAQTASTCGSTRCGCASTARRAWLRGQPRRGTGVTRTPLPCALAGMERKGVPPQPDGWPPSILERSRARSCARRLPHAACHALSGQGRGFDAEACTQRSTACTEGAGGGGREQRPLAKGSPGPKGS